MAIKKGGLGKGLDSLIPESKGKMPLQNTENGEHIVKINKVEPNREQPRRKFKEDELLELADSIRQFGVIQPLLVKKKDDYYEIIAGERRWRAAKMAGIKEIPVIVKDYTSQEILEISLIENIQRENLNPIEEAIAYKRLLSEFHMKQDEVAERVSKSRTAISNTMRLLKLDERVQNMVIEDEISAGHARALIDIEDAEEQYNLALRISSEGLSVRDIENIVRQIKRPSRKSGKKEPENIFVYKDLEEKLLTSLGTKVSIRPKANGKGKIEIEYYSNDELEHIFDLLTAIGQE